MRPGQRPDDDRLEPCVSDEIGYDVPGLGVVPGNWYADRLTVAGAAKAIRDSRKRMIPTVVSFMDVTQISWFGGAVTPR